MKVFSLLLLLGVSGYLGADSFADSSTEDAQRFYEYHAVNEADLSEGDTKNYVGTQIGSVFSQGRTNLCWAYASYFAVRSFNLYHDRNPANNSWDQAINRINNPNGFRNYVNNWGVRRDGGRPEWFFQRFTGDFGLGDQGWRVMGKSKEDLDQAIFCDQKFVVSDNVEVSYEGDDAKSAAAVVASLRKGSPVVRCGDGHCVVIYGAYLNGNNQLTNLSIADSRSPRSTYTVNGGRFMRTTNILMMR